MSAVTAHPSHGVILPVLNPGVKVVLRNGALAVFMGENNLEDRAEYPFICKSTDGITTHSQFGEASRHDGFDVVSVLRVVALFVSHDSIYKWLLAECFDAPRDAKTYTWNQPVVCHPPCQLWGNMAKANFARSADLIASLRSVVIIIIRLFNG